MGANANGWPVAPIKAAIFPNRKRRRASGEQNNAEWRPGAPVPVEWLPNTPIASLRSLAGDQFNQRVRDSEVDGKQTTELLIRFSLLRYGGDFHFQSAIGHEANHF